MKECKRAEQSLKDTAKGVVLVSLLWGLVTNDLRISSISNTALQTSKYLLKNDKEVQRNAGTFIGCKLRKYLNKIF